MATTKELQAKVVELTAKLDALNADLFKKDFSWVNKINVTKGNILSREHKVEVLVTNDLSVEQIYELALSTIKRQVQAKFRTELTDSEDPEFLHTTYPEPDLFTIDGSALQETKRDPGSTAKRNIAKASKEVKLAILAQLKAELEADA
jgi:hypothetical protein